MYDKFIDFYNNYPTSHTNGELWLKDHVKLFYIVNTWPSNSTNENNNMYIKRVLMSEVQIP